MQAQLSPRIGVWKMNTSLPVWFGSAQKSLANSK